MLQTHFVLFLVAHYEYLLEELSKSLLARTNSKVRPSTGQINVEVIGALYQIVDVSQRDNMATFSAYFDLVKIIPIIVHEIEAEKSRATMISS